jgi:hypothetical protein
LAPRHLHEYVLLMHRIASPLFGQHMSQDYMGVNRVLWNVARCTTTRD